MAAKKELGLRDSDLYNDLLRLDDLNSAQCPDDVNQVYAPKAAARRVSPIPLLRLDVVTVYDDRDCDDAVRTAHPDDSPRNDSIKYKSRYKLQRGVQLAEPKAEFYAPRQPIKAWLRYERVRFCVTYYVEKVLELCARQSFNQ